MNNDLEKYRLSKMATDQLQKYRLESQPAPVADSIWTRIANIPANVQRNMDHPDNVVAGALKGAGSTLFNTARLGHQAINTAGKLVGREPTPLLRKPDSFNPVGTGQKIGFGAERVAEFLVPGGLVTKGTGLIAGATHGLPTAAGIAARVAGGAALEGISAAGVTALQGGSKDEIKRAGILATALSVPFKAISEAAGPISNYLTKSAENKATQALAPTTKANKELAERIVPEMLKRRVSYMTRSGLESKADEMVELAGEGLETAYDKIPRTTKFAVAPVLDDLEKVKDSFVVTGAKGARVVPSAAAHEYQSVSNIQKELIELASGESDMPIESVRSFRMILDKAIKRSGKGFGFAPSDGAKLLAQKEAANSIRRQIASQFPDVGQMNKEFNFWKSVSDVVGSTILRTKGQGTPLGESIAEGAGAAAGVVKGGGLGNTVLTAVGFKLLKQAVTSPAWRNTSALMRQSLADAIINGQTKAAEAILNRIVYGSALVGSRNEPEEAEDNNP